jgi:hypothetical protein
MTKIVSVYINGALVLLDVMPEVYIERFIFIHIRYP